MHAGKVPCQLSYISSSLYLFKFHLKSVSSCLLPCLSSLSLAYLIFEEGRENGKTQGGAALLGLNPTVSRAFVPVVS